MKRVLLIGGSGQLGTAIIKRWSDCEIVAPPRDALAIEQSERLLESLKRIEPDVLVNAAAFHDVDRCEEDRELAFEINALAVGRAAKLAARCNALFVTMSTDYVFDGRKGSTYDESDPPNPLSAYGASKLAGERLAEASGARTFVVRTCGVYGPSRSHSPRGTLIDRVLGAGSSGQPVRVVSDVVASPTFAGDLADALRELIDTQAYGLYHAAGAGAASWFEFAREAVRQAAVELAIEPIPAQEWTAPAVRPRVSPLENAKLTRLGIALPGWRDGIAAYLASGVR